MLSPLKAQKKVYLSPDKIITILALNYLKTESYKVEYDAKIDSSVELNFGRLYRLGDDRLLVQFPKGHEVHDALVFSEKDFISFYPNSSLSVDFPYENIINKGFWFDGSLSLDISIEKIAKLLDIPIAKLDLTKNSLQLVDKGISEFYYSEELAYDLGGYLYTYCLEIIRKEYAITFQDADANELPEEVRGYLSRDVWDEFDGLYDFKTNFRRIIDKQIPRYEAISNSFLKVKKIDKLKDKEGNEFDWIFPPLDDN